MLPYPNINPIAFSIGALDIHWYGVSYLLGFVFGFLFLVYQGKTQQRPWDTNQVGDLIVYVAAGVIFGGQIGYGLIYQTQWLWEAPWQLLMFWEPGRSFHGGFLGVVIAVWIYGRRNKRHLIEITDFIVPAVAIGIAFGRIGNFINQELWGRVTDVPWAMVFPLAGPESRHPSQLYACFLEGILLLLITWWVSRRSQKLGVVSGVFAIGYSIVRFVDEFFREPDWDQGFVVFDWMTMGQLLSLPMGLLGLFLLLYRFNNGKQG